MRNTRPSTTNGILNVENKFQNNNFQICQKSHSATAVIAVMLPRVPV